MLTKSHKQNLELVLSSLDKTILNKYKMLKSLVITGSFLEPDEISSFFTPELLAVFFMKFGHHTSCKKSNIHFYTRTFSESGISFLRENLLIIYKIDSTLISRKASLAKGYSPEVSLNSSDSLNFKELISPFILEPFFYKLEEITRAPRPDNFNDIEITQEMSDVIFGTLLGDASLNGGKSNKSA